MHSIQISIVTRLWFLIPQPNCLLSNQAFFFCKENHLAHNPLPIFENLDANTCAPNIN